MYGYSGVTVGAVAGTGQPVMSFDAAVLSILVDNFPHTCGQSITVTGLTFGIGNFTGSAAVEQQLCSTAGWSSATTLCCMPIGSSDLFGYSLILVTAVTGTGLPLFSVDTPTISHISANVALSGRSSVTVTGLNFGGGNHSATGSLEASVLCSTSLWSALTSLTCLSNPVPRLFGVALLTVGALAGTGLPIFTADVPFMTDVIRNSPHSGMSFVTISGLHFGQQDNTPSLGLEMSGNNGGQCLTAAWTAGTSTTCLTNRLAQLFGFLQVTVGAATGTSTPAFTFDSAASSVLIGNFAGSGGSSVTTTGLSFGLTNHTLSENLMIYNTAAWSSATSLLCLAGKTSAIWGDASITIAATVGTGSPVFTFDAAIITYATYNGPLSGSFFLQKRYTDTQFNGLHFGNINYICTAVVESWSSAHTTS